MVLLRSSFSVTLTALSALLLTANPSALLVDAVSCTNVANEFGNVTYGDVVDADTCEQACKLIKGERDTYSYINATKDGLPETSCVCGFDRLCSDKGEWPNITIETCVDAGISSSDECRNACRGLGDTSGITHSFLLGVRSCTCNALGPFCDDSINGGPPGASPTPSPASDGAPNYHGTIGTITTVFSLLVWSYF